MQYTNRTMYGALLGGAAGLVLAVVILEGGLWLYRALATVAQPDVPLMYWIVLVGLGLASIPAGVMMGMRLGTRSGNGSR